MVDTLEWLRAQAAFREKEAKNLYSHGPSWYHDAANADSTASALTRAADEIESLREAIKHCPVGPCPVLANLALKELV